MQNNYSKKIAIVTAIIGGYEKTCKDVIKQSYPADFYCFTDNLNIGDKGYWKIINAEKYRFGISEKDNNKELRNSLYNNQHSFNRAKFFKLNLHRIEELKDYDIIIWLDGTIEIINEDFILNCVKMQENGKNFMVYEHNIERNGLLNKEVEDSHFFRYTSVNWNGQNQPYQDIDFQYNSYLKNGFKEKYFLENIHQYKNYRNEYGLWVTCFIMFDMKKQETIDFFDKWWYHNMLYTTQDQISFPYIIWENKLNIYSLPDNIIFFGNSDSNNFFRKLTHGK